MLNGSESPYHDPKRSDLEILFDATYVLAQETEPRSVMSLNREVGGNYQKLKKILEKCEKKDLVKCYDEKKSREKYQLTQHGKELIYTWLDFIHRFHLIERGLLKSRYLERLPEKENSRLDDIIKKPWKNPDYLEGNQKNKRSLINIYRDFLIFIKSYYPEETYQWNIIKKVDINSNEFNKLKKIAISTDKKHIKTQYTIGYKSRRWQSLVSKKGKGKLSLMKPYSLIKEKAKETRKRKKHKFYPRGNVDELISLTKEGYRFATTFDKIMMEYELTDLVYSRL